MTWNRFERRGAGKIVKQMFSCGVCLGESMNSGRILNIEMIVVGQVSG
jgi:hypothetical protein